MKIGDLVEHNYYGLGVIIKINEPTPLFSYQVAVVKFENFSPKPMVTTTLKLVE